MIAYYISIDIFGTELLIDEALQCILDNNLCNDGALVICEKSNTEEITITDEKLEVIKEKQYGITDIVIFEYMEK